MRSVDGRCYVGTGGRRVGSKGDPLTMAHHPQTDGASERANQKIEAYLLIFCGNNPELWKSHLPTLKFSYNIKPHANQKESPLLPTSIPTTFPITNIPATKEWLLSLQKAAEQANTAHELARQKMIKRTTRGFTPFKVNDKVWLESKNLKLRHESKKLAPKREGPFSVIKVLNPLNYCLSLPENWCIHPVFHALFLSP